MLTQCQFKGYMMTNEQQRIISRFLDRGWIIKSQNVNDSITIIYISSNNVVTILSSGKFYRSL